MNIRTTTVLVVFLISFTAFSTNYDWGKTGHRATGEIAETYLTKKAKRAVSSILNGESLALVSTYADEIKSDKKYKGFSPWHYVNFSFDKKYGEETPSEYGDLIQGIEKCISVLKDEKSSDLDKTFHLKMLVHFLGDLHQPLHTGRGEDKGGNDIQVQWFRDGSNLHRVWDSDMIDYYGMSYSELSINTAELSRSEIENIETGTIVDWVHESQQLAKKVYDSANVGEKLGYKYMYDYFPIVRSQLQKGGVRLAKILNEIFG
ncbi:S1/P1 Nuclease [Aquimarina sp. AD10]|uniref:S1/P1 nuclease n=1 Tax=Aquimarina sp. AD10 TaxID=1714849 RepID=UPI000E521F18|nr:S1/P1 nuclease [Aquimarina sp. AD10]AXT60673.1 S1/P1 Nuclease [Aquimarina sp. AD10]RKN01765.1 S1/P1 Nuclease [Aquimarina sp. AD10]